MASKFESIRGSIETIIYSNEKNGWTVCDFETEDALICAVGYLPFVVEGDSLELFGTWGVHPTYGEQFKVEYYQKCEPSDKASIEKYLASGIIRGVRAVTAKKIVSAFGTKAFDVIRSDPMRLTEIKGISPAKAELIAASFNEQSGVQSIVMFLNKFGITPNFAIKIFSQLGTDAVDRIKDNPYILCDDVSGVGFKRADKIGQSMGFNADNEYRVCAGVEYILYYNSLNGHTYLPKDKLIEVSCNMLGVPAISVENAIMALLIKSRLCSLRSENMEKIYLYSMYWCEKRSAQRMAELSRKSVSVPSKIQTLIDEAEKENGFSLEENQREAVLEALKSSVMVITGGPGTGKTTIIKTLLTVFDKLGVKSELCAPTGRAAKRMYLATGREAKTIHRLLEMNFDDNSGLRSFCRNMRNPLSADVVIVDESSMIDIMLFDSLTEALGGKTRLIIVGDSDQLPSVGAGNVLGDIIASGHIKVCRLTEIFRQAKESMIVVNAHNINSGEYPVSGGDFFFMSTPDKFSTVETIVDLCSRRLPAKYEADDPFKIQVISPSKKGEAGVKNLNLVLQAVLNPPADGKGEYQMRDFVFREGDKVMQIKNNYNITWKDVSENEGTGVFNGDVGIIERIDRKEQKITVFYDNERRVKYDFLQMDEVEPAYAMTVHKSQGSEFDIVIIPMYDAPPMLLYRNLLYTAVTRAKTLAVLVGSDRILRRMVDNNFEIERFSSLAGMICDEFEKNN